MSEHSAVNDLFFHMSGFIELFHEDNIHYFSGKKIIATGNIFNYVRNFQLKVIHYLHL